MSMSLRDLRGRSGPRSPVRAATPAAAFGKPAAENRKREFRSTLSITGVHLTGKLLGVLKTLVIAAWFGASGALDAFWVAYTVPLLMPGMIRGVVATAFIPRFMHSSLNGVANIDWRGMNTLFTLVAGVVMTLAALVAFARDGIVRFMAPGLPPDVHALAADLTALMAIAVLLFGMNAIFCAVLQALRRFVVMSLESVLTNTVIIAGCVLFAADYGVRGLTFAVIAGFAAHTLLLLWTSRDLLGGKLRPAFDFGHADFRGPTRHMLPLLIGYFGSVAMTIIDRMFVSMLEPGAISILAYAGMIALLPMEVFGQAVLTIFYPALSREHANGERTALLTTHVRGLRLLLFVMLPVTVTLVMVADPVVTLLLERGAFSAQAGALTALALAVLALGLPGRAINYFNFRVFHARHEPWTAVGIGLFGVCLNTLLNFLLIGPFGVAGIAAATTIALTVAAVLSTLLLQRRLQTSIVQSLLRPVARLLLMTLALAAVAATGIQLARLFGGGLAEWQRLLLEIGAFIPGVLAFLVVGRLLGVDEVRLFMRIAGMRLRARRRRRRMREAK